MGEQTSAQQPSDGAAEESPRWKGERWGLPESGAGAAAPTGRRALAFFLDLIIAALVASAFTAPHLPRSWSLLAWVVLTVVPVSFFGSTPGMAISGIWVARMDGTVMVGVLRALVRCALTLVLIPALVWNADGRSWHDRLTGTLVLRRR